MPQYHGKSTSIFHRHHGSLSNIWNGGMGCIPQQHGSPHVLFGSIHFQFYFATGAIITATTYMPTFQPLTTSQSHPKNARQCRMFQRLQELLVPSILPQLLGQITAFLFGLLRSQSSPSIRSFDRRWEIYLEHLFVIIGIVVGALSGGTGGVVARVALRGSAGGEANSTDAWDIGTAHETGHACVGWNILLLCLRLRLLRCRICDIIPYLGIEPIGSDQ
mmetsp:Transcript_25833/g.41964  ORF Transcript_25833/g.41964 Transcript_25833/m.41964 type:complete len:219 (-) Transcript_25833:57-713(-)